jgi:hypothetical protein
MSHGDREASWAGHCIVFIGDHNFGLPGKPDIKPAIISATYPKVEILPADHYPDAIWATGQPLTDDQRKLGLIKALSLAGMKYDIRAYAWFIAKVAELHIFHNLEPLFTDPHMIICSGTVVVTQKAMKVDISQLPTAATDSPDFVCPADCLRWGLNNGWMSASVPTW